MKLLFILVALMPLLLELTQAAPVSSLDPYGRVNRNSRMSKNQYGQSDDEDDDQDDEEDDDEQDDEQDDDVYPPDFSKLFPNPDGRPVGPQSGPASHSSNSYGNNHPVNPQPGRPSHGPAGLRGPASLRGPIQAQHGQHQGGMLQGGPPSHDGPAPSYRPTRRGPPTQYRNDYNEDDDDAIPEGRQLPIGHRRVVGYPMRRIQYPRYPMINNRRVAMSYPRYPIYPQYKYTTHMYRPRYTPVRYARDDIDSVENDVQVPWSRAHAARIYNPWSHSPLRADAYNPQFVFNPTEMRARRRFRYHPSQLLPYQRMSVHSGAWGNPRDTYVHHQTGAQYGANYWGSRF